ncbi:MULTISPECIES: glucuronate isomerase [unclassified Spirosoma]|uniref:glucuronate isomerase n=1 Tax=unclassified Spirosoma TaxID=2621999 RepID=UPI00095AEF3C|nr:MULTISPECIES: glucuronate isomerase [unclassified Spirosoma]MBN8820940.1 glucuronate isomerase [Spirosoma sp.]OJW75951.1 MAG: glucuronate isomerase [Spirosoma sp. 48-14]
MKKPFLNEDFLLQTESARQLYHEFAKPMPIIDYHCHLPPDQIAENRQFENITQIWLYGDHYKWRAMRTNGVNERFCTGDADDFSKFQKWAETVPYTLRNPLYHWTHLELQRYFGIKETLNGNNARQIYDACTEQLQSPDFSVRNLMRRMNVETVCTTDDPVDSLEHHKKLAEEGFEIGVLPTFRPDKAMAVEDVVAFNHYVNRLEAASNVSISNLADFLKALRQRHDFFAAMGCKLSDHGLEQIYAEDYTEEEVQNIFHQLRSGHSLSITEILQFKSAMLVYLAEMDWEKGWTQQFHLGALRNNNSRMLRILGPDTGWDSIGDFSQAHAMARFLDRLDTNDKLAKTIIYNLNPADNELIATMIGNFNDGSVAGKVQFGSGWWFLDQKEGMERQINALSNMGLLSRFVGMLTDSRSFLSYPRHEYFRRILCNMLGNDIENGELPDDIDWTGQVVQNICYGNAKTYFGFSSKPMSLAV